MKVDLPEWLLTLVVTGREGEENNEEEDNDEGENGENDGEEGSENEGEGNEGEDGEGDLKTRAAELEKALNKERQLRRKAEREARRAGSRKKKDEEGEKVEEAEIAQKLKASQEQTTRLATKLRDTAVESAVLSAARELGFIDPTDAMREDVLKQIDVDQDEEDPSDIDIDIDSVKDAVKKLADKKKHLVGAGTPNTPSGGKFRKKGGENDKGPDLSHYPSLR